MYHLQEGKETLSSYDVRIINGMTHIDSQYGQSENSYYSNSSSSKLPPLPHQSINHTKMEQNTHTDNNNKHFVEILNLLSPPESQRDKPPYGTNKLKNYIPTNTNSKDGKKHPITKPTDHILDTKTPDKEPTINPLFNPPPN